MYFVLHFKDSMINTIDREPMLKEQVLKTTDYQLFSFLPGNRKVNMAHAKRLEKSFQRRHLFSPIIVNEFYQIIDGQHRYTVCSKLKLPIYYIVVNGYGLDEVQVLNTNASNWKKIDYLNAYCDLKFPEYLKFRNFMRHYPDFSFGCVEMLLKIATNGGQDTSSSRELITESNKKGSYRIKTFEEGEFICKDYDKSCDYAEKILQMKKYNSTVISRIPFVSAMIQLLNNENFDHEEFMGKLAQQPTELVDCVNVTQFKSLIEDIYNFKRRTKVNLRY